MNGYPPTFRLHAGLAGVIFLATCLVARAQPPGATTARAEASVLVYKKSMELRLDGERTRIRRIAEPVLERIRKANPSGGDVVEQQIKTQNAEAQYESAKTMRMIAEIEVVGYKQGTCPMELASANGQLKVAEADLQRADGAVADMLPLFMKNKKNATWSVAEKIAAANFEMAFHLAELEKKKAEFALERAKARLKVLNEYEKPKRIKELEAGVEKALADELSKKQTAQLERDKLLVLKKVAEGPRIPQALQGIITNLADAVRLDYEIQGKLARLGSKDNEAQEGLRKETDELARSLESNVSEAVRLFDDLRFAELSSEINFASTRVAPAPRGGLSSLERRLSLFRKIPPEDRAKLKTATQEEQARILKKAGFTDADIQEMQQMRDRAKSRETHK